MATKIVSTVSYNYLFSVSTTSASTASSSTTVVFGFVSAIGFKKLKLVFG